jgi:hypothetical protein
MNLEIRTPTAVKSFSDTQPSSILRGYAETEKSTSFFEKTRAHLNRQAWFIRLTNKEYWHPNVYFIPLGFYMFYLACRARSPFFFSAANPSIPTGGLIGEDKADISNWIPSVYRPKNITISSSMSMFDIQQKLKEVGLTFPIIMKPTVGARGLLVEKMNSLAEIKQHLWSYPTSFLLEEYIDFPIEAAVLYWKNPETGKSGISSVTVKEFLHVVGDGQLTVEELLMQNPRGVLQVPRLMTEKSDLMHSIPSAGEKVVVEQIGNHVRGTKFLNFNHLITSEMVAAYDKIQANLPDTYLFRLDLKTPSVSDLQNGKNIKIMEINGVGADPAHVFDPNYPLLGVYSAYFGLWKKIFEISTAQHRRGVPYMTWKEFKHFSNQQKTIEELID